MAYLLDTDTFSRCFRGDEHIRARIASESLPVYLSIIAVREALKGALATVTDAESPNSRFRGTVAEAYQHLAELTAYTNAFTLFSYPDEAEALFKSWPKSVHRIGPRDCRLAACAIVSGMTVVTCNTADFAKIATHAPELHYEDWSR